MEDCDLYWDYESNNVSVDSKFHKNKLDSF